MDPMGYCMVSDLPLHLRKKHPVFHMGNSGGAVEALLLLKLMDKRRIRRDEAGCFFSITKKGRGEVFQRNIEHL